jgi:hypothetical protein
MAELTVPVIRLSTAADCLWAAELLLDQQFKV